MKWEYKGRSLANPIVIIWRLFWFPIFKILLTITCIVAWFAFGKYAAENIWNEGK